MGNLSNLLLAASDGGTEGQIFIKGLLTTISIVGGIIGVLLIFYAIYLFFLMATASDEGKRKTAKSRVVKVFSSILIIISLVAILAALEVKISGDISGGMNNGSGGTLQDDAFQNAKIVNLNLHIDHQYATYDNKKGLYSIVPYDPYNSATWQTKHIYHSSPIQIGTSNIQLQPVEDTGIKGKVKKVHEFKLRQPDTYFEPKFWEITPGSTGLSIRYELRYGLDVGDGKGPNLGKGNERLAIMVNVEVEYKGQIQTSWVNGFIDVTLGDYIKW